MHEDGHTRTTNVALNTFWAFLNQAVTVLVGLYSRKIFLTVLGAELLGVNSLFSDVLALFSFADLGFGAAITFALYEPIAQKDEEKVKGLLELYRKIYWCVIVALIVITIVFCPFLKYLKTEIPLSELYIYYFIYQFSCIIEYVWVYRETYLIACQQARTLSQFNTVYVVIKMMIQAAVVQCTGSFAMYLLSGTVLTIFRKFGINIYIMKIYPETRNCGGQKIESGERRSLISSSWAILVHRLGNLAIHQTDSLIVSSMAGVEEWGMLSNYIVLKKSVGTVSDEIYKAVLPSIGNFIAADDSEEQIRIFKLYDFFNFWLYGFCFIALGNLSSAFIELYFGEQFSLSAVTVFLLFFAFYIDGLRGAVSIFREAKGAFKTDKWFTVAAAAVNLFSSVVFVRFLGVGGVYLGTVCAMVVLHISRTVILFKEQYNGSGLWYFWVLSKHVGNGLLGYIIVYFACTWLDGNMDRGIISFAIKTVFVLLIPNLLWLVLFYRDERFVELKKRLMWYLRRKER